MTYRIERQAEGIYRVLDQEDAQAARVSRFQPGPMVSVTGGSLMSPGLALIVAEAITLLANELSPPCEFCNGTGTYRKDGPSEIEFDTHAICPRCN